MMAASRSLAMAGPTSGVTLCNAGTSLLPASLAPHPCIPLRTGPHSLTQNPVLTRAVYRNPFTNPLPNLLVLSGAKKERAKKWKKISRSLRLPKGPPPNWLREFAKRGLSGLQGSVNGLQGTLNRPQAGGSGLNAGGNGPREGGNGLTVAAKLAPEEVWDREERRWEREELRWLREEKRWIKEEVRWEREREQWAQEEAQLRIHVEALRASLAETQLAAENRADSVRASIEQETAQAQILGEAALEAQIVTDAELQAERAKWREEEQALLAEVDALKTALAEVLDEATAKAEAARMTWQKHEATLQAELAELRHALLEAQAVAQARSTGKTKAAKPTSDRPIKPAKPETIVAPTPSAGDIIAAVASRTATPKQEVKGVFASSFGNGASTNGASANGASNAAAPPATNAAAELRTLRYGAEGPDVRAVQEELERLGFYCGEEEMEADAYEDSTDSAVKSWQCSVGAKEDGVLTPALQVLLLGGVVPGANQEVAAVIEELVQQKDRAVESERYARTSAEGSVSGSTRRVYLLGENRWEEPDRLPGSGVKAATLAVGMQKCFACKGEGKVLCTECEGTGDLNVEEQFMSWAGEDPHCPYCQGTGATNCDSCAGTGVEAVALV